MNKIITSNDHTFALMVENWPVIQRKAVIELNYSINPHMSRHIFYYLRSTNNELYKN